MKMMISMQALSPSGMVKVLMKENMNASLKTSTEQCTRILPVFTSEVSHDDKLPNDDGTMMSCGIGDDDDDETLAILMFQMCLLIQRNS